MKRAVTEELQRRKRDKKRKVKSNQKREERIIFNKAVDMRRKVAEMWGLASNRSYLLDKNQA